MIKRILLICLCLSSIACTSKPRIPNAGVELSQTEGISLIRVSQPQANGHGRFELKDKGTYELEAFSLDITSLIELIAPNYPVHVNGNVPAGRYDYYIDVKRFPSENKNMQRLLIQQTSYKEIERALKLNIKMDILKRKIDVK